MQSIYANNIATQTPPPSSQSSEIQDSLEVLQQALLRLDGHSIDLVERLSPVLRNEPTLNAPNGGQSNQNLCPLSDAIRAGATHVDAIASRIAALLSRLAV